MKKLYLLSILVIALPVMFGLGRYSKTPHSTDFKVATEPTQLEYVNKIRADHQKPALTADDGLNKVAQTKVADMKDRHYFDHTTPDGQPFYDLAIKTRPGLTHYGENIGECFTSNPGLFTLYTNSPEHLKNITGNFSLFGSATIWDDTKHCYLNANEFGD